jgi:hypothetical protein
LFIPAGLITSRQLIYVSPFEIYQDQKTFVYPNSLSSSPWINQPGYPEMRSSPPNPLFLRPRLDKDLADYQD